MASLLALRDIRLLGLRGCCGVGDEQMQYVGKLVSLEALDLHSTEVGDAGLVQLTGLSNLEQLDLSFSAVTDKGLVAVGSMTGLKILVLQGTSITEKGMENYVRPERIYRLTGRDRIPSRSAKPLYH